MEESVNWRKQLSALRYLPPFFRMVWRAHPGMALGNVALRLLRSVIPVLSLYVGKLIIDEVLRLQGAQAPSLHRLWGLVGAEFALVVLSDVLARGIGLLDGLLGDLFSNRTSERLIRHAAMLDLYHFEDAAFYDKLERARRQTVGRTVLMSMALSQVQDLVTLLSLGAGLVVFNPWLLLILVVAVIPSFLGESYFDRQSYSLARSWTPERRELDYLRYIGAGDHTAKEVKVFGLAGFIADRFAELAQRYYLKHRRLALRRAGWGGLLAALSTASYYAAYGFILLQAVGGLISIGTLTFLAGSFKRMHDALESILSRFSSMAEDALYLQDLFDFFDIQPRIKASPGARPFPQPLRQGFTFENVGFQYPGSAQWTLRGLSFQLRAGEKLALVGENGAGKTTLVKLLARLYEPTEGRILIDGVDMREYDPEDLRRHIGIIFQDYVRFHLTASENIAIGRIDHLDDMPTIEQAARKSLAHELVEKLPEKYAQKLGKRFDGGIELSGGQWQKIALARAYMRDAQLLILDEPTAALDARAEYEVFQRFAQLIEGRTAVLISHRFSTVRMADRILFLENGQLLELGSHDELLAQNGKYAELFRLQARGYV